MGIQERKEREKEARREEILAAAEKVFFEKGLATTTVDEIAQAAELSKGTLYLYYRSKEDLYLAVASRGLEVMHEMFVRAISTDEHTIKRIINLEEAYYQFFQRHQDYFRMFYFFENPQFHTMVSSEMMEQCLVKDKQIWELVSDLFKQAIQEGLFHARLEPLEVGIILWSNANGFLRLLDRNDTHWNMVMNVDLRKTLWKSNALLLEAMMTEDAQKLYGRLIPYFEPKVT